MAFARIELTFSFLHRGVASPLLAVSSCSIMNRFVDQASSGLQLETHMPCRNVWGNLVKPNPRGKSRPNKHRDARWSKLRAEKVLRIDLPDYHRQMESEQNKRSPEELRAEYKKKGILMPSAPAMETPVFISSTGAILDEYKPPESDRFADLMTKSGAKLQVKKLTSKGKSFRATRKVRTFDEDFDPKNFGSDIAQDVYIQAHRALAEKREKDLHEFVTEKAYPEMLDNTVARSIYWDFVKSLEPPRVVQVRAMEVVQKSNVFSQVVVRFHTQQILAIYDRFGRLVHGHPHVAKDVLEYVVFEKHLANIYGKWRLHAKIAPEWLNARKAGGLLTHVEEDADEQPKNEDETTKENEDETTPKKNETENERDEDDEKEASIYDRFGKLISKYKK